jgi:hypothetical protein
MLHNLRWELFQRGASVTCVTHMSDGSLNVKCKAVASHPQLELVF